MSTPPSCASASRVSASSAPDTAETANKTAQHPNTILYSFFTNALTLRHVLTRIGIPGSTYRYNQHTVLRAYPTNQHSLPAKSFYANNLRPQNPSILNRLNHIVQWTKESSVDSISTDSSLPIATSPGYPSFETH